MSSKYPASLITVDRCLRGWLGVGLLTLVLVPGARGADLLIGWLPYWLVVWPALSLLLLHRQRVAAWLQRQHDRRRERGQRHRVRPGRQARRPRPAIPMIAALLAALRVH